MFPQHKLFSVGLMALFTSTHLGCAGQGVRNMFSRNETAGYKSLEELEELEAKDRALAEAKDRGEVDEKPSMTTRLASWSPFGKSESKDEETPAVSDARQAEESSRSQHFLGLPLRGRDAIEPDPFLGSAPLVTDREESGATPHKPEQKQSVVDRKPVTEANAFSIESGKKSAVKTNAVVDAAAIKQEEDKETKGVGAAALSAKAKSKPVSDEDAELAERFEQHFLLNSVGTISKTDSDVAAHAKETRAKVESTKAKATAKQHDVANNASHQIDQIDRILAGDSTPRKSRTSTVSKSPKATQGNSLAAFDRLLGAEGNLTLPDAAKKVTPKVEASASQPKNVNISQTNVNVADAETLFGAAAARQQARAERLATVTESRTGSPPIARTGAWSKTSDGASNFSWNNADQAKPHTNAAIHREDSFAASGDHDQIRAHAGKIRDNGRRLGAPPAAVGEVDDNESAIVKADAQFRNEFVSSAATSRIVTANYSDSSAAIPVRSVSTGRSAANDGLLTSAPMAPNSDAISGEATTATGARTGLIQSLSGRNWLLLIGGIIIIVLLFAPSRTKPLAMNG